MFVWPPTQSGTMTEPSATERAKWEAPLRAEIEVLKEENAVLSELYSLARCGSLPSDLDRWEEEYRRTWGKSHV